MTDTGSTSNPSDRLITLVSNDKQEFKVERNAIRRAGTIETLILDSKLDDSERPDQPIPLLNVDGKTLQMVIDYCIHEVDKPIPSDDEEIDTRCLSDWVKEFLDLNQTDLYELILAENYLDIKTLLHEASQIVADMIRQKPTEEIRRIYAIENDFTPEEYDQVKKEGAWCAL